METPEEQEAREAAEEEEHIERMEKAQVEIAKHEDKGTKLEEEEEEEEESEEEKKAREERRKHPKSVYDLLERDENNKLFGDFDEIDTYMGTFYHGTDVEPSVILEEGLFINNPGYAAGPTRGVFLTSNFYTAQKYGKYVYSIESFPAKVYYDESEENSIAVQENIPGDKITLEEGEDEESEEEEGEEEEDD